MSKFDDLKHLSLTNGKKKQEGEDYCCNSTVRQKHVQLSSQIGFPQFLPKHVK